MNGNKNTNIFTLPNSRFINFSFRKFEFILTQDTDSVTESLNASFIESDLFEKYENFS